MRSFGSFAAQRRKPAAGLAERAPRRTGVMAALKAQYGNRFDGGQENAWVKDAFAA